ncbi:unnamed protein product [Leptidea sinapis]|uniref:Uncharacterized protein n=1 Tax=Leptidea sinapis TaxID=189913 RepID=A0A5E4PQY7_9NEOP|nr:unnamed protein product [Leptidea sinapis]
MELSSVLVLSLVSLVTASPHGYGASNVARAEASASAFGNGFSKSSSSSFASSSASASSSSSTYSFSGAGTNGITHYGQTGGCPSGHCQPHSPSLPSDNANNKGFSQANAAAIAGAGAHAEFLGPDGLYNPTQPCSSGKCDTGLNPNYSTGCKSGLCGPSGSGSLINTNQDHQVAPVVPEDSKNFLKKSGQGNSNPTTFQHKDSVVSNQETQQPTTTNKQLPPENKLNQAECDSPDCEKPSVPNSAPGKPALHLTPPYEETICTSHNCNFGYDKNGKLPSSYNVPILANPNTDSDLTKSPLCEDGKCKDANNYNKGNYDYSSSQECTDGNCDIYVMPKPTSQETLRTQCKYGNCEKLPEGSIGSVIPDLPSGCSSGKCDIIQILSTSQKPISPTTEKPRYTENENSPPNYNNLPKGPTTPEKPFYTEKENSCNSPNCGQNSGPNNYESMPHYTTSSNYNIRPLDSKHEPNPQTGNNGIQTTLNPSIEQGVSTNEPYKGKFDGATRILSYSSGPPEQYSHQPDYKNMPHNPSYNTGSQHGLLNSQIGGNIFSDVSGANPSSHTSNNYKPDYPGANNKKQESGFIFGSSGTSAYANKPFLDHNPSYANPALGSISPIPYTPSYIKDTDAKKPLYTGGFGGPTGLLQPNDVSIPSTTSPHHQLPCVGESCIPSPHIPSVNVAYKPNCVSGGCVSSSQPPSTAHQSVPHHSNCVGGTCGSKPDIHSVNLPHNPDCVGGSCVPNHHIPSTNAPHQPNCLGGACAPNPHNPTSTSLRPNCVGAGCATYSYNPSTTIPQQSNCISGTCAPTPTANSVANAAADAKAVPYTGGFGGPPGLLKPYDSGKLDAINNFDVKSTYAKNNNIAPFGTGGSNLGPKNAINGIYNSAQAGAVASSSAVVNGGNYGRDSKGCNSGCSSHPSDDTKSKTDQGKEGENIANISAKSIAVANSNAQGHGGAVATASAHASAGVYVNGGR